MPRTLTTRVLIIDPMALARKTLADGLSTSPHVAVVAVAPNARLAERKILADPPDVLLVDPPLPIEAEAERLTNLRSELSIPVVLLTAPENQHAAATAFDVGPEYTLVKPGANLAEGLRAMLPLVETTLRRAHRDDLTAWRLKRRAPLSVPRPPARSGVRIIAVGASTGGTEALTTILAQLPAETPGMVLVQHMPGEFTRLFAARLNETSALEVKEAADGDEIKPGRALLAPGGFQMRVVRSGRSYRVQVARGEKVSGHCPSVDVLMHSVAEHAGAHSIGVLLTGMGSDGAEGLKAMKLAGSLTLAQDEQTCVVFGMPREAYRRGAVDRLVPLQDLAAHLLANGTAP